MILIPLVIHPVIPEYMLNRRQRECRHCAGEPRIVWPAGMTPVEDVPQRAAEHAGDEQRPAAPAQPQQRRAERQ